jgi:hypothetical protein
MRAQGATREEQVCRRRELELADQPLEPAGRVDQARAPGWRTEVRTGNGDADVSGKASSKRERAPAR